MAGSAESFVRNNSRIVFKGRKDILSNYYPCPIYYRERWFNCAEQALQFEKALHHNLEDLAENILRLKSGYEQTLCSKFIEENDDWKQICVYCMKRILLAKLDCVSEYKQLLLNSKGLIVNATPTERFWSSGLSKLDAFQQKQVTWPGQNILGKLHMDIREELQTVRKTIASHHNHMHVACRSNRAIEAIEVDLTNVLVTVYAKNLDSAYAITDGFSIPRKVVRIVNGLDCT